MNFPFDPQSYLAAIITSSDDAIISKDLSGNITSWNQAAERMLGYSSEEAVGKHISIIIPNDRLADEDYIMSNIKEGKRIEHFETVRVKKTGELLNLSVTVSPIKNANGVVIGASKVVRDMTEFKKAERATAYLGAIIESSDDAIVSKNLNGIITSWNKSAERIFGYIAEEAIGKHVTMLIPTERLPEEDRILSTLKKGERVDHFETWRLHKAGHLIPVSLTVSPIRDKTGLVVGASKIARDISERVKSDEALKEMARKKDDFLANMSHELRTPMNAVIGLSNLLQSSKTLSDKDRKFVDTLKMSADSLLELINDLLDFAKIESETLALEMIDFDLIQQIEKTISVMNVRAMEKGIQLRMHYSPSINRFYKGDPLRIQQILMNLVSNAIKFTEQGTVDMWIESAISSDKALSPITIRVVDTGIGIEKDKHETIFEKFMQADSSISRRYGGTGLGLAITHALVTKMRGSIRVESNIGIGTTFTVYLPLAIAEQKSPLHAESSKVVPLEVKAKNILLVEDYEPNILVASTMLETFGYDYDVAHSGLEAVRAFVQGHYDVILMDVQMHELDGLAATKRIREIEAEKSLPRTTIIAMTAHVREQDKEKCIGAGMDDFIPKPFEPKVLLEKLAHYIMLEGREERA